MLKYIHKISLLFIINSSLMFTGCNNEEGIYDNSALTTEYKSKIIAHRGVWNVAGSCENSRTSISLARSLGIWGSEFDIHQTSDGYWVLNHDAKYNGYQIKDTNYATISKSLLANGETLPTLNEILEDNNNNSESSLMIEIKSGNIKNLINTLEPYKDIKKCYISFLTEICEELIDSGVKPVYLLLDEVNAFPIDYYIQHNYDGVSIYYKSLLSNPQWIKRFHDAGLTVTVWTVNSQDLIMEAFSKGVDYVVTDCAESLIFNNE